MLPHIAVILTDSSRKILWVNDDFRQITGYELSEVYGKKPSILQGPDSDPTTITRIREKLNEGISVKEEIINYRKNGEKYICKLVIHPVYNDSEELTNFIAFEVDGNIIHDEVVLPLLRLQHRYQTSSLKGTDELKLYYTLLDYFKNDKPYLNPNLTLRAVSDHLNTNTKYLSQVVNNQAGANFQIFVNRFRVQEAKSKLNDPNYSNLTLFGVGLVCGFKNKSTFYKVFKELTGKTPRQYVLDLK